jgi:hypothetical protein
MKKLLSLIVILSILGVAALFSFNFDLSRWFSLPETSAAVEDNVSGWAWSENIGWISFNNTSGGGPTSYGVNIDSSSGNFSGYAWSENIGWVSFAPTGQTPDGTVNPAKLNISTNAVTGWARACAGTVNGDCNSAARTDGWDGWIKLAGTASNGTPYGVSRSGCDLTGFAWGSDVVGWIKFNGSDYKVVTTFCEIGNQPPSASDFGVEKGDYCSTPSHIFSWTYSDQDGDSQSQFRFQVDNNSDFSSPEIDRTASGLSNPSPSPNNQPVTVAVSPGADQIGYNSNYYWQVRVWDSQGGDSGWINGTYFSTEKHQYPTIDFSWTPQNPNINENTQFTDISTCYDDISSGSSCNANDSFWWTFLPDGSPANSTLQNPLVKFLSTWTKSVTLRITDSDGLPCPGTKPVNSFISVPDWKEIAPF